MVRGCSLTVVKAQTSDEAVLKMNPDGIFRSNGPGDPAPCDHPITAIPKFPETDIPTFGLFHGPPLLRPPRGAHTVTIRVRHP
ncbi:glutamine amidotransferase-related protein, partial [Salmonella enterica]|uniref:glutamine amidotransferase-related protein n=1 Tax=Salmonella enterica TaxID=28901 RepID=UPI00398C570E